jgi:hypothetical protein
MTMSLLQSTRLPAFAAVSAAAVGFALFASSGPARASDTLSQCTGASRTEVVKCCDRVFRNNPPNYMGITRPDCNRMTICSRKAGANYCHVVLLTAPNSDHPPGKGRKP